MTIQREITIDDIGRCSSCEYLFCDQPNTKKLHPEQGCAEWSTPESSKLMAKIKTGHVEKPNN